jgi:hypothetical protein
MQTETSKPNRNKANQSNQTKPKQTKTSNPNQNKPAETKSNHNVTQKQVLRRVLLAAVEVSVS